MCLKHEEFRKHLTGTKFEGLSIVIVDEMRFTMGGDFRKAYTELSRLSAFFPLHIPIPNTSATIPPPALLEVRASLLIDPKTSFFPQSQ